MRSAAAKAIPFSYLKDKAPPPVQAEYSGSAGQVIHHKFVVVDFNDDAPIVFAGSPSGSTTSSSTASSSAAPTTADRATSTSSQTRAPSSSTC